MFTSRNNNNNLYLKSLHFINNYPKLCRAFIATKKKENTFLIKQNTIFYNILQKKKEEGRNRWTIGLKRESGILTNTHQNTQYSKELTDPK